MITVQAFIRDVQRSLPGFVLKGRLLFIQPIGYLLRGIYFDSSSFSKESFYPTVFIQPLYRNVSYHFFTFGGRLHGLQGEGWDLLPGKEPETFEDVLNAIRQQARPLLSSISTPNDLARASENQDSIPEHLRWTLDDLNVMEMIAHSWLLSGSSKRAMFYLQQIKRSQRDDPDDRPWVKELEERVDYFMKLLTDDSEGRAQAVLREWVTISARVLGLESHQAEDFRQPGS